ncbi:MAG: recombination regulator RecX [Betaproteobacteria bacterium]|nr:recombination regulator RecX [Betaproteobacteria bacterium]
MAQHLRAKALALLARRDYSRAALAKKLAPHAESEAALNCLLDALVAASLLSDARYASNRVGARGVRYGNARLAYELGQEGVPVEEVAAAIAEADAESGRCHLVWQKKFSALPVTLPERARQVRFLRQRGFSSASIRQVLGETELDDVS